MKSIFCEWSKTALFLLAVFGSGVVSFFGVLYALSSAVVHSKEVIFSHAAAAYESHVMAAAEARGLSPVHAGKVLSRDEIIEREAAENKIHPDLVRAIIAKESSGRRYAIAKCGTPEKCAVGLMQVLPSWSSKLGLEHWTELANEETNISAGSWIMGSNMRTAGEDLYKALVLYRVGPKGYADECDVNCAQTYARDVIARFTTRQFTKEFFKQ